jgi:hypothetical protein
MSTKFKLAVNAAGFQAVWWACVLGASFNKPMIGPLAVLIFIAQQYYSEGDAIRRTALMALLMISGTALDSMMSLAGLVIYAGGYSSMSWLAPLWITAMWAGFALTIDSSLSFLRGRFLLSALAGAICGPLAYLTAARFGAVSFGSDPIVTFIVLAVIWAVVVTAIFNLPELRLKFFVPLAGTGTGSAESSGGEL